MNNVHSRENNLNSQLSYSYQDLVRKFYLWKTDYYRPPQSPFVLSSRQDHYHSLTCLLQALPWLTTTLKHLTTSPLRPLNFSLPDMPTRICQKHIKVYFTIVIIRTMIIAATVIEHLLHARHYAK